MSNTANEWTLDGFVDHFDFVHHKMLDHKYVWILGAGASYASGIPLGSQLVDLWLKEMQVREDSTSSSLEGWATAATLGIKNFEYGSRAAFYPQIYERRFRDYPDEGYAYLESVMSGKDPSPGYSILAAALAADPPRHNVVITTNFDNLVADALSIYTDTFPFVAGHESLTGFVRVSMRRPLICKIHRDLLLGPQNDPRSLKRLHDAWGTALRALFQHYTPIFVGYGGNDDTLMDLLESLQPSDIKGELIWCYYENVNPSDRIVDVVISLNGVLVPVPAFDLLMVLLGERMQIGLLDEEISKRALKRTQRYRDRIQRLDTVTYPNVTKALAATLQRSGGWWVWYQKAKLERDPVRRDAVYKQGIQYCAKEGEMYDAYAKELQERGDNKGAEEYYRKGLEVDPMNAQVKTNFAIFLAYKKNEVDEAEGLVREALEDDPTDIHGLGVLADILSVYREVDEAEKYYQKVIDIDNTSVNSLSNYAYFLLVRGRLDEAATIIQKAKNLDTDSTQLTAELSIHSAIFERLMGRNARQDIEALDKLLSAGFKRAFWNFDALLKIVKEKLPADDQALFSTLTAAILDPLKVDDARPLLAKRLQALRTSPVIGAGA